MKLGSLLGGILSGALRRSPNPSRMGGTSKAGIALLVFQILRRLPIRRILTGLVRAAWKSRPAFALLCIIQPGLAADVSGITEAQVDVTLTAPVAGVIGKQHFKEGDVIRSGQILLELDNRLEELEVQRRQSVVDNATAVLTRTEQLAATSKVVPVEELEKQRAERRIAQTELEYAQEQLKRRKLVAPFSGVVVDLFGLDPGEGVQPQTPVARNVDTSRCWWVANVEAALAATLKVGTAIRVRIESVGTPKEVPAEIRFVSPVADPGSGLVRVKALFDNSAIAAPAGVTVRGIWDSK